MLKMECHVQNVEVAEHHMDDDFEIIYVLAGTSNSGPVLEELPAKRLAENLYLLLASPGLALNIAKDDLITLDENKKPIVVKRGENFCIQIYSDSIDDRSINELEANVGKSLHGSLDGRHGGAFAFSIPVEMGFDAIKSVFNEFSSKTGVDWYYANIYKFPDNQEDDTLLNWWEK